MTRDEELKLLRQQAETVRLRTEIECYSYIANRLEEFNAFVAAKSPDDIPMYLEDRILRIIAIPFGGEFE